MGSTAQAMKPMFLPGVDQNPQPSPYADLIRNAQESGSEYSKIWHRAAWRSAICENDGQIAIVINNMNQTPSLLVNSVRNGNH